MRDNPRKRGNAGGKKALLGIGGLSWLTFRFTGAFYLLSVIDQMHQMLYHFLNCRNSGLFIISCVASTAGTAVSAVSVYSRNARR